MKNFLWQIISGAFVLGGLVVLAPGCTDANGENTPREQLEEHPAIPDGNFGEYWYQGVAELNRFALKQARYGEVREGDAVLIFVTEDFLADEQVKLESAKDGRDAPSVLKMNFVKKFITGLYPYSMMTSVFTPVDQLAWPHSLKVTTSSQEWCGHTFTQLNRVDRGYRLRQFSYFEKEGDLDQEVQPDLLEDEVWTRIRLNPDDLPEGEVNILPGTMVSRLQHSRLVAVHAFAERSTTELEGEKVMRYTLRYEKPARTLSIDYRATFPYEILAWSETYSDFGTELTTSAVRTDVMRINYWAKHGMMDTALRRQLGLASTRP